MLSTPFTKVMTDNKSAKHSQHQHFAMFKQTTICIMSVTVTAHKVPRQQFQVKTPDA